MSSVVLFLLLVKLLLVIVPLIAVNMAISKKGKRKLIHNGKTYYWGVMEDYDSLDHVLTITSEDKKLVLHYTLEQFNADIINPMIRVVGCLKGKSRTIRLFPPEGDESATPSLVIKILTCYEKEIERENA